MCILIYFPGAGGWRGKGGIMHRAGVVSQNASHPRAPADTCLSGQKDREPVFYTCLMLTWFWFVACLLNRAYYRTSDIRRWHGTAGSGRRLSRKKNQTLPCDIRSRFPNPSHFLILFRRIILRIRCDNNCKVLGTVPVTWLALLILAHITCF